jgi:hypothetical protein
LTETCDRGTEAAGTGAGTGAGAGAGAGPGMVADAGGPAPTALGSVSHCVVCWAQPARLALVHGETAHLCVCGVCAPALRSCPMCRQVVMGRVRVFTT